MPIAIHLYNWKSELNIWLAIELTAMQESDLMSSREGLIMESKSLKAVLDLPDWKIGFAAWIFAGYSPLEKKERGVLIRLTDETEISCGGTDYIEAEKAQREIKQTLERGVAELKNVKKIDSKERFDRNLLIDIALENDFLLVANLSFLGLLDLEGGLSAFLGSLGDDLLGTFLALLKPLDMFLSHPLLVLLLSLDDTLKIQVSVGQLFDHAVHFLISPFLGPFEFFCE